MFSNYFLKKKTLSFFPYFKMHSGLETGVINVIHNDQRPLTKDLYAAHCGLCSLLNNF